ncbi:hypothetical protein [Natranaerobius trueperi]|uniref:Uncharacterized protein n=1 Tax=Natranaerobius trueperi TaxID=759412 RepID=A0A226BZ81_9FIRM|nr:hypothetical protein [Natranaerobius trueperi]OWZ83417.1 hypothetical protein CDO51_08470 [Natranaerobius trueperi]
MQNQISVTELIPYTPSEIAEEEYFFERIKIFINKVREERKELKNYRLYDVGLTIKENAIIVKLYFEWENTNETVEESDNSKVIDISEYL